MGFIILEWTLVLKKSLQKLFRPKPAIHMDLFSQSCAFPPHKPKNMYGRITCFFIISVCSFCFPAFFKNKFHVFLTNIDTFGKTTCRLSANNINLKGVSFKSLFPFYFTWEFKWDFVCLRDQVF